MRKLGPVSVLAREFADDGGTDFSSTAEPYRRELLAHCYRMTGSLHDAEDLVQETFLRAWKAYDRFEGKSSVRTWLHRIATNTCLTALETAGAGRCRPGWARRVRTRPGSWSSAPRCRGSNRCPSRSSDPADPSVIVGSRESVRLAFVAALQHLSPRQRAVLVLRDVLQWKAAEVADAIGVSTAAVNSLLQRARSQLEAVATELRGPVGGTGIGGCTGPVDALHRGLRGLRHRPAGGVVHPRGHLGDATIRRLVSRPAGNHRAHPSAVPRADAGRYAPDPVDRQRQPAAAMYMRDGEHHVPFQLHVLDMGADGVSHVVAFLDTALFAKFGLPEWL